MSSQLTLLVYCLKPTLIIFVLSKMMTIQHNHVWCGKKIENFRLNLSFSLHALFSKKKKKKNENLASPRMEKYKKSKKLSPPLFNLSILVFLLRIFDFYVYYFHRKTAFIFNCNFFSYYRDVSWLVRGKTLNFTSRIFIWNLAMEFNFTIYIYIISFDSINEILWQSFE